LEETLGLGFVGGFVDECEVIAGAQGLDKGAGERALVGDPQRGGEVARVGVDRKPEHHELHERDADHDPEGHAVALHLDELL